MTSQQGQHRIEIHVLPNISRSKGNQTMKFGLLIECNMRNIFLEKSYTQCGGETSPKPFFEKVKLSITLDQQSKVLCSLFLLYGKLRAIEMYGAPFRQKLVTFMATIFNFCTTSKYFSCDAKLINSTCKCVFLFCATLNIFS